jgi:hypothetical protein
MTELFLHHHLGLGDHIICNGLVRYLSQTNLIKLFCKTHNINNVKQMYLDNHNIDLIDVYNDNEAEKIGLTNKENYIRIGVALNGNWPPQMEESWDRVFYYQLNIPYEYSWSLFKYNRPSSIQNIVPNNNYAFICNKGSDGQDRIDYSKIDTSLQKVYSDQGGFFDNLDLITNATEIHCVNSSYIHFIDRITTSNNTILFYHKNFKFKRHGEFSLKKDWNIV